MLWTAITFFRESREGLLEWWIRQRGPFDTATCQPMNPCLPPELIEKTVEHPELPPVSSIVPAFVTILTSLCKVEGEGTATQRPRLRVADVIHNVTPTSKHQLGKHSDSSRLKQLAVQRQSLNEAMERAKKRLNTYLDRIITERIPVGQLRDILNLS